MTEWEFKSEGGLIGWLLLGLALVVLLVLAVLVLMGLAYVVAAAAHAGWEAGA